jgi:hypothetical protein
VSADGAEGAARMRMHAQGTGTQRGFSEGKAPVELPRSGVVQRPLNRHMPCSLILTLTRVEKPIPEINVELPPEVTGYSTHAHVGGHVGTTSCPGAAKRGEGTGHCKRENPVKIHSINAISSLLAGNKKRQQQGGK